ncbi:MAG: hypothetical protein AAFO61_02180, partial [Pseudomonadota bacterium]
MVLLDMISPPREMPRFLSHAGVSPGHWAKALWEKPLLVQKSFGNNGKYSNVVIWGRAAEEGKIGENV